MLLYIEWQDQKNSKTYKSIASGTLTKIERELDNDKGNGRESGVRKTLSWLGRKIKKTDLNQLIDEESIRESILNPVPKTQLKSPQGQYLTTLYKLENWSKRMSVKFVWKINHYKDTTKII